LGRQRDEQEQLSGTEQEAYEALQKELTELRRTCVPQEATQKELTDLRGIRVASDLAIDAERQKLASMTTENRHLQEAVATFHRPSRTDIKLNIGHQMKDVLQVLNGVNQITPILRVSLLLHLSTTFIFEYWSHRIRTNTYALYFLGLKVANRT
jgi:hypothetical protein